MFMCNAILFLYAQWELFSLEWCLPVHSLETLITFSTLDCDWKSHLCIFIHFVQNFTSYCAIKFMKMNQVKNKFNSVLFLCASVLVTSNIQIYTYNIYIKNSCIIKYFEACYSISMLYFETERMMYVWLWRENEIFVHGCLMQCHWLYILCSILFSLLCLPPSKHSPHRPDQSEEHRTCFPEDRHGVRLSRAVERLDSKRAAGCTG